MTHIRLFSKVSQSMPCLSTSPSKSNFIQNHSPSPSWSPSLPALQITNAKYNKQ